MAEESEQEIHPPPSVPTGRSESAARWLLRRLIAHVEIWRLDLFSYAGLVSVAGALLASDDRPLWRLVGAWLAPTLGWLAAMYGGDYFDRELDAVSKPQRPVPSGRVTAGEALGGMIACVLLGMVVAVILNPRSLAVVILALVLGVSYSKYFKAHGVWGNIVRGGVTAMSFVQGTLATSTHLTASLLPLALVFWLHDSGSNVLGAICDREGDREGGYRTFPVRHGDGPALWLMVGFDVLWFGLAASYPWLLDTRFDHASYAVFLVAAALMGAVPVVILFRSPRPIPRLTGLRAHEVLVIERLVLTSGLVAAAAGPLVAVALLVPSAAAWLVASVAVMRQSYEPTRRRRNRVPAE